MSLDTTTQTEIQREKKRMKERKRTFKSCGMISETSTLDEINIRLDTAKEEINLKI